MRIIGASCGIVVFLFWLLGHVVVPLLSPSLSILFHVVLGGLIGGMSVSISMLRVGPRADVMRQKAVQGGMTAGLAGSLVVAALIVIAISIQAASIRSFYPSANFFPLLVAMMCVLPGMLAGLLGSLIAAVIRFPEAFSRTSLLAKAGSDENLREARIARMVFIALFVCAALSPFLPYLTRKPILPPAPPIQTTVAKPAPTPQPWSYSKPEGFATADPLRWQIGDTRQLQNLTSPTSIAMSPDGTLLAYCKTEGNETRVSVTNLLTLKEVANFPFSTAPAHLAWSPDGKRIFYMLPGDEPEIGVLDIDALKTFPLPLQKIRGFKYPEGQPHWQSADEILFRDGTDSVSSLSLDTLSVSEVKDAKQFTPYTLANTNNWGLNFGASINQYDSDKSKTGDLETRGFANLAASSKEGSYTRAFKEIKLERGDVLLTAPDASIIVQAHGNTLYIHYLTLRAKPRHTFEASMPIASDKAPKADVITELVKQKNLRGFICAPVVNPLNGKVVGGDKEQVHGIGCYYSWNEKKANVWVAEEYEPISESDVIVDLHSRDGRLLHLAFDGWGQMANAPTFIIPPLSDEQLNPFVADIRTLASAIEFRELHYISAPSTAKASDSQTSVEKTSSQSTSESDSAQPTNDVGRIRQFIYDHHKKARSHNLPGMVTDYAESVEYYDKGVTNPDVILKDEEAYHLKWLEVFEEVATIPEVRQISAGQYEVKYQMRYSLKNLEKKTGGISHITMTVVITPRGPKITKQNAVVQKLY